MYKTYHAREILIGSLVLGGENPVRIQSMANTDTNDIEASLDQAKKMISAGAELVRFTTQGSREADNLGLIRKRLRECGLDVPVIADVHFNPSVAEKAATQLEKVRINPGNYTEKRSDESLAYSEEKYNEGLNKVKEKLCPLLEICKTNNTAIRIGVNHGSLSPRVMQKYGDTPRGMAESALEFIRICNDAGFEKLVVSMKSSNTRVMVQSVRLLAKKLTDESLPVPLHLGVTEAGDGEEGRIRSAVGIAPLLAEGLGDTIRVSLTEAPEKELPVADALRALFPKPPSLPYNPFEHGVWDPFSYAPPATKVFKGIGGGKMPVVISGEEESDSKADLLARNTDLGLLLEGKSPAGEVLHEPVCTSVSPFPECRTFQFSAGTDLSDYSAQLTALVILKYANEPVHALRAWIKTYFEKGFTAPLIFRFRSVEEDPLRWLVHTAGVCGSLLIDGLIDGLWIDQPGLAPGRCTETAFSILQAARSRFTKTEYIACPSCGRTLFNIEDTLQTIRLSTAHLPGLKIAVMGCIVNGPGEMADADYGYVGAGKGLVTLYKGKTPVKKGVPEKEAVNELIDLIKENGDWKDPMPSEEKK